MLVSRRLSAAPIKHQFPFGTARVAKNPHVYSSPLSNWSNTFLWPFVNLQIRAADLALKPVLVGQRTSSGIATASAAPCCAVLPLFGQRHFMASNKGPNDNNTNIAKKGKRTIEQLDTQVEDGEVVFTHSTKGGKKKGETAAACSLDALDMYQFTPDRIRNFCIVAHIDHGKTSLSNAMMRMTGCLPSNESTTNAQESGNKKGEEDTLYLDKLQVEKERGITVKAQTTSLFYRHRGRVYLLNLIDTPGHVDFSYEVTRSLRACDTAVLVVDASQGIQAQTVANYLLSFDQDLHMVPVLNKIDMPSARVDEVSHEVQESLGFARSEIILASAKTGEGVAKILEAVIDTGAPPVGDSSASFVGFLFDSWFDTYRGVVCMIKVMQGSVSRGDSLSSVQTGKEYTLEAVGIMYPEKHPTDELYTGQVGYIVGGMKRAEEAKIGDTFYKTKEGPVEPLAGFTEAKPMVFSGVYPTDPNKLKNLREAMDKLMLTDASITYQMESSDALGTGLRAGFLGLLHMDVVMQRLETEHNLEVVATAPTVPYKVLLHSGEELTVTAPSDYPSEAEIQKTMEPMASVRVVIPKEYLHAMTKLCRDRRGEPMQDNEIIDAQRLRIQWRLPLSEVISDFIDKVKSVSRGYATMDYEPHGYKVTKLTKLNILLNGETADPLSLIVPAENAQTLGRDLVKRLKGEIKRHLYPVAVQAAIGNKIIARETIKAVRKDVTAKCYGGDITRKRKLLEKQKEGRKRLRQIGNVELSQDAFLSVLKRD